MRLILRAKDEMAAKKKTATATAKTKTTTSTKDELPTLPFETSRAFDQWLAKNHASSSGVWLKLAKAGSGIASIRYAEAVEVALTWGWIDGQARRFDDTWYVQRFTPRTARSIWSVINREKALALIEAGKMKPPGLAEVERAKKDGRWERAYTSPSRSAVPDDLAAALARDARAAAFFAKLDSQNRYAILHRLMTAVKPETRKKRLDTFVAMLSRGEKLHA
jgi:uncharacterized protein YdeI (YjbR/CyaY-like superfamily)